jgi:hypothetical protein
VGRVSWVVVVYEMRRKEEGGERCPVWWLCL